MIQSIAALTILSCTAHGKRMQSSGDNFMPTPDVESQMEMLATLLLANRLPLSLNHAGRASLPGAATLHSRRVETQKMEMSQPENVELTYFDIKATPGEKVRLALSLAGIPFKDNRLKFPDWADLKPKTKYGQLPMLSVDGVETYQSGAMLRWAGSLGDGSLYPLNDPEKLRKIEEMLGISDDLQRAFTPALYMGMAHTQYGYPQDWPEKDATVKKMRETFLSQELPKYMGFLSSELEKTGLFLTGDKPSIADCQLFPQIAAFTRGFMDHIPSDCLKDFPTVTAWLDRMSALPEISDFYRKQEA
jgi:glutathione S-transferase